MKLLRRISLVSVFLVVTFFAIGAQPVFANNLSITNVRLINHNQTTDTIVVEFDISWNNSWYDSVNKDAVWIFAKLKSVNSSSTRETTHITLKSAGTNPAGFSRGSGTAIDIVIPSDKKGCFIQRSNLGTGTLTTTDIQLVWDYAADGLDDATIQTLGSSSDPVYTFKLYGIEMVYIPEGGFHVGDGDTTHGMVFKDGSSSQLPCPINSEDGISFQNVSAGGWYYLSTGAGSHEYGDGSTFNLTSSFPKGYHAFYLMKYEVTQGQYASFLNMLEMPLGDFFQPLRRTARSDLKADAAKIYVMTNTSTPQYRNVITCPSNDSSTFSATSAAGAGRQNRACNYLSWMDFAAYADWAALRPMTEFEYEKACRGPYYPVDRERAWGEPAGGSGDYVRGISGTESGSETAIPTNANRLDEGSAVSGYSGGDGGMGPLRAGIFATSTTTTRPSSGAGYYGNLDLSYNVEEQVVAVGNAIGNGFSGTHGDGYLTTAGDADNPDWPGYSPADLGVVGATGSGTRGFSFWAVDLCENEVSCRFKAQTMCGSRSEKVGGRLARTAP